MVLSLHFRLCCGSLPQVGSATWRLISSCTICTHSSLWPCAKKNETSRSLIHRCRTNITTLIDQNEKRLTFPELFTPVLPGENSPFHWNLDKFTKRDLLELLTALCRAEAIVDDRGKPAAYARVVSSVAERLHLSISESSAYNERDTILNIKRNPAAFISHLVTCLTGSLKI